jgi:hypothetical protein
VSTLFAVQAAVLERGERRIDARVRAIGAIDGVEAHGRIVVAMLVDERLDRAT